MLRFMGSQSWTQLSNLTEEVKGGEISWDLSLLGAQV